jgi:hypothetical protein
MWSLDEASQKIQEIPQVAFFNTFKTVFFIIFHLTINKVFVIDAMPSGSASKVILK